MSVRSALAPLRGFPSRYRGGSNVRRPSWVHGDRWQPSSHSQHDREARYSPHSNPLMISAICQRRPTSTNSYQQHQQNTNRIPKEIPVTPHALKLLEPDQSPSETVAATTNVGSAGQFWSRRRGGRQGRACGAPLRGRRALTALRRREIGLPCCRGSLSVTSSDVSDLASPAQSASARLCKTLQNAAIRFRSLQNPQCKINAISCKKLLQNASKCFVLLRAHLCICGRRPHGMNFFDVTAVGRCGHRSGLNWCGSYEPRAFMAVR